MAFSFSNKANDGIPVRVSLLTLTRVEVYVLGN